MQQTASNKLFNNPLISHLFFQSINESIFIITFVVHHFIQKKTNKKTFDGQFLSVLSIRCCNFNLKDVFVGACSGVWEALWPPKAAARETRI